MSSVRSLIVVALATVAVVSAVPSCLDESGQPVDWFVMIKAPKERGSTDQVLVDGHGYIYLDSNTINRTTAFPNQYGDISSAHSALGSTLQQVYDQASNLGYVFYNDEVPISGNQSSSHAHAKGVVSWSTNQGFWLIHSMPQFPVSPSQGATKYNVPDSAVIYGQSFMCVTLSLSEIDIVGSQLQIAYPQIYDTHSLSGVAAQIPNMELLMQGQRSNASTPMANAADMHTQGRTKLQHLVKNTKWNQDLYTNFVAPHFSTALQIETWMRPHRDSSFPPSVPFEVVNVMTMQFPSQAAQWKETEDHSKWVISETSQLPLVCVGDINYQLSQYKRGGGTMCMENANLWSAFNGLVTSTEKKPTVAAEDNDVEEPVFEKPIVAIA